MCKWLSAARRKTVYSSQIRLYRRLQHTVASLWPLQWLRRFFSKSWFVSILRTSSKLADWNLDLDVTKKLYPRIPKLYASTIFLQPTAWLQELLNISKLLSLHAAARTTACSKLPDTAKLLLPVILTITGCSMKFLKISCPVVKTDALKGSSVGHKGKKADWTTDFLIFICIDWMQDRTACQTQIGLWFHKGSAQTFFPAYTGISSRESCLQSGPQLIGSKNIHFENWT